MKFTLKYKVPFVVAGVSIMTAMTNLPSAPQAKPFEIEKDNAFEKTDSATRQDAKAENTIEFTPIVPTHATAQHYNVVYYLSNGDEVVRSGGTRAWRNNNPGCIRPGSIADAYGAIGSAGGFAVFPDEQTGIEIIRRAIEEPLRQIVANAGKEGAVVVDKVRNGEADYGYNARKDVYENLKAAGVVDPAKVTRVALENAASIAGMFLTTECVITDIKEEHPAPAMPAGGMGGMM